MLQKRIDLDLITKLHLDFGGRWVGAEPYNEMLNPKAEIENNTTPVRQS